MGSLLRLQDIPPCRVGRAEAEAACALPQNGWRQRGRGNVFVCVLARACECFLFYFFYFYSNTISLFAQMQATKRRRAEDGRGPPACAHLREAAAAARC